MPKASNNLPVPSSTGFNLADAIKERTSDTNRERFSWSNYSAGTYLSEDDKKTLSSSGETFHVIKITYDGSPDLDYGPKWDVACLFADKTVSLISFAALDHRQEQMIDLATELELFPDQPVPVRLVSFVSKKNNRTGYDLGPPTQDTTTQLTMNTEAPF